MSNTERCDNVKCLGIITDEKMELKSRKVKMSVYRIAYSPKPVLWYESTDKEI